eukprot:9113082-Pyramimonas_sp.AAC.1
MRQVMEFDMDDFFAPRVQLCAGLTNADPETYPMAEDGQGGPRGELVRPAEEATAKCFRIDADVGPEDAVPAGR